MTPLHTFTVPLGVYVLAFGGLVFAATAIRFDSRPFPRAVRRFVAASLLAIALSASMFSAHASAAEQRRMTTTVTTSTVVVYDECNDPQYIHSWWWYAWGCWAA